MPIRVNPYAMAHDGLDQLTPRERDCLRLVAEGRSSKEIALALELSPFTVDEYVRSAVQKLGAANRREAARILVAGEAGLTPEELGDEPQSVASPADSAPAIPPVRSEEAPRWRFPLLRNGRQFNDLRWATRFAGIVLGAVGIIVLFSQLANGMAVIQSIFQGR